MIGWKAERITSSSSVKEAAAVVLDYPKHLCLLSSSTRAFACLSASVCVCVCVFMYLSLNCIAVDCIYLIPAPLLRSLPPQVAGVGELAGALCETLCSQPGPPLQRRTQENTHQRQQRDEDCIPALLLSPRPLPPPGCRPCLLST